MSKSKTYHNTTNQKDLVVQLEKAKFKTQEEIIKDMFEDGVKKSASDIYKEYPLPVPLTSIRRGISNLKFEGSLIKLDETKIGIYGKPEHYYNLNK